MELDEKLSRIKRLMIVNEENNINGAMNINDFFKQVKIRVESGKIDANSKYVISMSENNAKMLESNREHFNDYGITFTHINEYESVTFKYQNYVFNVEPLEDFPNNNIIYFCEECKIK